MLTWLIVATVPFNAIILFLVVFYLSAIAYQNRLLEQFEEKISKRLMWISDLLYKRIRILIYVIAVLWVITGFGLGFLFNHDQNTAMMSFWVRFFGFSALLWFFAVLTPGLLGVYFPRFELNSLLVFARRALGKVTFFLALIHASLAFLHNFKGSVDTFYQISLPYQIAALLGLTALIILLIMTLTSFDTVIHWLTFKRWKRIHRLIYLAVLFSTIHAFVRGTSFTIIFIAFYMLTFALFFMLLELGATAKMIWKRRSGRAPFLTWSYLSLLVMIAIISVIVSINQAWVIVGR